MLLCECINCIYKYSYTLPLHNNSKLSELVVIIHPTHSNNVLHIRLSIFSAPPSAFLFPVRSSSLKKKYTGYLVILPHFPSFSNSRKCNFVFFRISPTTCFSSGIVGGEFVQIFELYLVIWKMYNLIYTFQNKYLISN